jgi:hypothetical protein
VAIRWGTTGVRAGWASREAEAQWEEGERPVGKKKKEKRMGRGWAERLDGPEVTGKILFRIKFDFFEYTKALEICARRFRRNFDMRIFPKFF